MKKNEPFSFRARGNSFRFAWSGILEFFKSEHNAWFHLFGTLVVIEFALVTSISKYEVLILVMVTGMVWIAELFNTAIEKIMDFTSTERSAEIKYIKDISAGAVLISALVAVIAGCIIFIPKF